MGRPDRAVFDRLRELFLDYGSIVAEQKRKDYRCMREHNHEGECPDWIETQARRDAITAEFGRLIDGLIVDTVVAGASASSWMSTQLPEIDFEGEK